MLASEEPASERLLQRHETAVLEDLKLHHCFPHKARQDRAWKLASWRRETGLTSQQSTRRKRPPAIRALRPEKALRTGFYTAPHRSYSPLTSSHMQCWPRGTRGLSSRRYFSILSCLGAVLVFLIFLARQGTSPGGCSVGGMFLLKTLDPFSMPNTTPRR